MRIAKGLFILLSLSLLMAGCGESGPDYGPTIEEFNGKITQNGEPVSFDPDSKVLLQLVWAERGERFGIPVTENGTFKIGWMPLGKYTAVLEYMKKGSGKERGPSARPDSYQIPDGLTIEEGQTQYTIELGKDWKP